MAETEPEYRNSPTYKVLEIICTMLDIQVYYGEPSGSAYEVAEVDNSSPHIIMSRSRIESADYAARVLGHEIGHCLIEGFYCKIDEKNFLSPNAQDVGYLIELQCDQIGNSLYLLAKGIAEEVAASGEDIRDFINRAISETMERDGKPKMD